LRSPGDQRRPPVEAPGEDGALLAVREPEAVQRLHGADVDVLHARGALEAARLDVEPSPGREDLGDLREVGSFHVCQSLSVGCDGQVAKSGLPRIRFHDATSCDQSVTTGVCSQ